MLVGKLVVEGKRKESGGGGFIYGVGQSGGVDFGELDGMTMPGTDQTKITPRNDFDFFCIFNEKSRDFSFFGVIENRPALYLCGK